jgi:hypothetical protein
MVSLLRGVGRSPDRDSGEILEAIQGVHLLEDLGIKFQGGVGRVHAGAAAGASLSPVRGAPSRCREKAAVLPSGRRAQCFLVLAPLEYGQAVVMRLDAAHEHIVAIQ